MRRRIGVDPTPAASAPPRRARRSRASASSCGPSARPSGPSTVAGRWSSTSSTRPPGRPAAPAAASPATSTVDFVRGLPRDVVCSSDLWAQHVYVGDPDTVPAVEAALDVRGCAARHRVWITETGVGGPHPGGPRPTDPASLRAQCRSMDGLLGRWHRDRRVQAAFQYSFREDDLFPVGLVNPPLTRVYEPYEAWAAWARRRHPS